MFTGFEGSTRIRSFALAGLVCVCLSGCRTDTIFNSGAAPKGPTVAVPQTLAPRPVDPEYLHGVREADLIEEVVTSREAYVASLRALHESYAKSGRAIERDRAAYELSGLDRVQCFQYVVEAEVPPADLRPTEAIPEADRFYAEGVKLMKEGGYHVPGIYRRDKMLTALKRFKALIEQHPTSDKIDDAAFYCGEIHKEYFPDQELIAVRWYERAIAWNPKTPHPARFQAAVQYDYRLHDRARALELYHGVLEQESEIDITNTRFSSRRIDELTREGVAVRPRSADDGETAPQ
ncbi:MAG: hypothetical protein FLDDKLPJ_01402 [Phycisphaerae bacterium]|nr:hypothetical protein [Phycisphaerae bacterium]